MAIYNKYEKLNEESSNDGGQYWYPTGITKKGELIEVGEFVSKEGCDNGDNMVGTFVDLHFDNVNVIINTVNNITYIGTSDGLYALDINTNVITKLINDKNYFLDIYSFFFKDRLYIYSMEDSCYITTDNIIHTTPFVSVVTNHSIYDDLLFLFAEYNTYKLDIDNNLVKITDSKYLNLDCGFLNNKQYISGIYIEGIYEYDVITNTISKTNITEGSYGGKDTKIIDNKIFINRRWSSRILPTVLLKEADKDFVVINIYSLNNELLYNSYFNNITVFNNKILFYSNYSDGTLGGIWIYDGVDIRQHDIWSCEHDLNNMYFTTSFQFNNRLYLFSRKINKEGGIYFIDNNFNVNKIFNNIKSELDEYFIIESYLINNNNIYFGNDKPNYGDIYYINDNDIIFKTNIINSVTLTTQLKNNLLSYDSKLYKLIN